MRSDRFLVCAVVASLVVSMSVDAHAYCRTRTVRSSPTSQGCAQEGLPLYHPSTCVPYHVLTTDSVKVPTSALSGAFARAFATWSAPNAVCTPGITGIELANAAPGTPIVSYTKGERGQNVFGVVQGPWPHADPDTLALTTLTFDATTGEIFDTALEVKEDVPWSLGGPPPADGIDLDSAMLHEVGHALGLAHDDLPNTVMRTAYALGTDGPHALAPDDMNGICAIYPDRQTRLLGTGQRMASRACDLSTASSAEATCGDPVITHGCGVAPAMPARKGWLAGLAVLGTVLWRAKRRASLTEQ